MVKWLKYLWMKVSTENMRKCNIEIPVKTLNCSFISFKDPHCSMTISTEHKSKLRVGQQKNPTKQQKIHSLPLSRILGDDRKNRCPCYSKRNPNCPLPRLGNLNCSPSPTMVTSSYEWKKFWVGRITPNNQTNKLWGTDPLWGPLW